MGLYSFSSAFFCNILPLSKVLIMRFSSKLKVSLEL